MDSQCDYLVLDIPKGPKEDDDDDDVDCEVCKEPIRQGFYEWKGGAICVSLDQATAGAMVPYVDAGISEHASGEAVAKSSTTAVWYVADSTVVELKGDIHLQDIPPNGTWLSSPEECLRSILRLRGAYLACIALPELNRMVIEQKNDDGLLGLIRDYLADTDNLSWAVDLFGAFACDAMLAPVLHVILRSSWVKERKDTLDTNNDLKLGWAQEFYDYKCVAKDARGCPMFTHLRDCGDACGNEHTAITRLVLRSMRLSGYTPWSAVHAVRVAEVAIAKVKCRLCRARLLASCAFLIECAAVEASGEGDWLVRNEAVIELCWILYGINFGECPGSDDENLKNWALATVAHSVGYHVYKPREQQDAEALVVMFANDHVSTRAREMSDESPLPPPPPSSSQAYEPDHELESKIRANARYSTGEKLSRRTDKVTEELYADISTAVDVMDVAPIAMEARAQDPEDVTLAILLCFPRVAENAIDQLTFEPPGRKCYTTELWPVFVNSTRACYQLFRALAIPVAPSPAYLLELLARGWRGLPERTLQRFLPMTAGPCWHVDRKHYDVYFLGPLGNLVSLGVMTESDRGAIVEALHRGLVPCFAGRGDSSCDRLLSSTLALSFAACGVTALSRSSQAVASALACDLVCVTSGGLLYFAAWYLMVYLSAIYAHPTLRSKLLQSGSDADKCLCRTFDISDAADSVVEYRSGEMSKATRLVFRDMLAEHTRLRLVQLYVPEMLTQLPYVRRTALLPATVKMAIESRDRWFAEHHGRASRREADATTGPKFEYLGNIAYGLHSSIKGKLSADTIRPVATSLVDGTVRDFDLWCDSLFVYSSSTDHGDTEESLRGTLEDGDTTFTDVAESVDEGLVSTPDKPIDETTNSNTTTGEETTRQHDVDVEVDMLTMGVANLSVSQGVVPRQHCVCKGLVVDSVENLGFDEEDAFLAKLAPANKEEYTVNDDPVINNPCMTNIGRTSYSVRGSKDHHDVNADNIYPWLIQALWVLTTKRSHATSEPRTPETLAVMVHLIVKRLPSQHSTLSVCNDIVQLREICDREREFVPITAIVGGMFGLNIQVIAHGSEYNVFNPHYVNRPHGALHLTQRGWCVISDQPTPRGSIPVGDTLKEYLRLNDIAVKPVKSDGYCGFHTASVLLDLGQECSFEARDILVRKTAAHIFAQRAQNREFTVYLNDNKVDGENALYTLLMTPERWLSVEEVQFILLAHGKNSLFITKNSYPLYSDEHVYFHIDNNHFQPIIRATMP